MLVGCKSLKETSENKFEKWSSNQLYEIRANYYLKPLRIETLRLLDSIGLYTSKKESNPSDTNQKKIDELNGKLMEINTAAKSLKLSYLKKNVNYNVLEDLYPENITETKNKIDFKDKFMLLNAFEFNFSENKFDYVGHFNIYSPTDRLGHFGFNAGIMKINYSQDSIIGSREDRVLINPLDEIEIGLVYQRKYNQYKTKNSNKTFSAYIQPLYKLNTGYKKTKIFGHAHMELLISKFSTCLNINTIQTVNDTIQTQEELNPEKYRYIRDLQPKYEINKTYLNGYFGLGFTWDLYFAENSNLFFQPTIGYTTNYPQPASVNNTKYLYDQNDVSRKWNGFYLVRANYRQKLSTGSELILGADIRGLFPTYAPYYAFYSGINLSLEKITELFKN